MNPPNSAPKSRPNILYVHSHDTGRYIQPYGYAVSTPNMQRLAEEGVLFRQCFCAGPTCSPSRAALVTGQSPHSSGMLGLAHRGWELNDYSQHIVHTLREAGYTSALSGVQHVAGRTVGGAEAIGYDRILEPKERSTAGIAEAGAEFIRGKHLEGQAVPGDRPFFLSVGFTDTHRKYPEPGPGDDPRYTLPPAPVPDTPETRYDMACFKTAARRYDAGVGIVLRALEEAGLAGDTLVINTTDHGIAFPRMKCSLTDSGIGVMLIVRGPGGFTGGRAVDSLVSHVDIFPTVCELLGIDRPARLEGRSMLPLVAEGDDRADEINDEIFSEVTYHAAYEPKRCCRTRRWKYIRRFDGRTRGVMPNCDDGPSKSLWLEHGLRERPITEEQLYDLVFDPNEARDLAADPGHAEVLAEMRSSLEAWMKRTDDPLLKGPVPPPPHGVMNDPDGLSPNEPPRNAEGEVVER